MEKETVNADVGYRKPTEAGTIIVSGEEAELSAEKTFDSVFWGCVLRYPKYVIPLINEAFSMHFSDKTEIYFKNQKQVIITPKEALRQRLPDGMVELVEGTERRGFHFEVETWPDSEVILRIAEYDAGSVFESVHRTKDGAEMEIPRSVLIVLHDENFAKKQIKMRLIYPGGVAEYDVPVVHVRAYSLEEMFQKNMLLLLPFYPFRFSEEFAAMEEDEVLCKKMLQDLECMENTLSGYVAEGRLDSKQKALLMAFLKRILLKLTIKYGNVRKGVEKTMGRYFIWTDIDEEWEKREIEWEKRETEWERRENEWEQRENEMKKKHDEQFIAKICNKLRKGKDVSTIAEELEEDEARVQAICNIASEFEPDYDEKKVAEAVFQETPM